MSDECDRLHDLELQTVKALEKIANHMETNKRGFERLESIDKDMVKVNERVDSLISFNRTLTRTILRIGLALATGGVVVIWWIVQRWIEHR